MFDAQTWRKDLNQARILNFGWSLEEKVSWWVAHKTITGKFQENKNSNRYIFSKEMLVDLRFSFYRFCDSFRTPGREGRTLTQYEPVTETNTHFYD